MDSEADMMAKDRTNEVVVTASIVEYPGLLLLVVFTLLLSACTPTGALVGAGASTGVAVVQERGLRGRALDLKIEAAVFENFINADLKLTTSIGVEVYEGRVLLTGATHDVNFSDKAVRLAWRAEGVKDVINEIQVGQATGIANFAQDSWITVQLKAAITLDKQIFAINYAVETVNGVVYLIGIGRDRAELDRVIDHANSIKFVHKVISHVRIKHPTR